MKDNRQGFRWQKILPLVCGPLLFVLILVFFHPQGLSYGARAVLATTSWIAVWWIFEVISIAATALLPLILFPLTGALDISTTASSYGHKYVFLYLGGFILAIAIEKWQLHRRIALKIIRIVGTESSRIILGFMLATAFMSMWISNTATTVMMLPIGLAIVAQQKVLFSESAVGDKFAKNLMLAIAYSASIGGIATLIGTPPNLVLAGVVEEQFGIEISFSQWIKVGLPISVILLLIAWRYLSSQITTMATEKRIQGSEEISKMIHGLGKMKYEEKAVLVVFIATALLWIFRSYLFSELIPALDDTIIAIMSAIVLFLIPSRKSGEAIVSWEDTAKLPWGVIILFGGGLALAAGFQRTGLARWLAEQLISLDNIPIILLILIVVAAINFLTEITSNLATTAMLLPVFAPMAFSLGVHPYLLLVSATIAASCAFMLPVATPPNAIVFGSGYISMQDMIKRGLWLNIISILLISLFCYFFLDTIWDFDPWNYPLEFPRF